MKRNFIPSINLQGGSSLIVIFGVLCLVVFSVLSLSTALAGSRLEKTSVDATTAYYEADSIAEEKIAELRSAKADGTHDFSIDISDNLRLDVSVKITGDDYEILRWQVNSSKVWEIDDSLNLWTLDN